jgi:hypothetical protein
MKLPKWTKNIDGDASWRLARLAIVMKSLGIIDSLYYFGSCSNWFREIEALKKRLFK